MAEKCPNPMEDPEGYDLWMELHVCTFCDGVAEDHYEETGEIWVCRHCDGTGIEPGPMEDEE